MHEAVRMKNAVQAQRAEPSRATKTASRQFPQDALFVDTVSALVDPGYYEDSLFSLVESLDMESS